MDFYGIIYFIQENGCIGSQKKCSFNLHNNEFSFNCLLQVDKHIRRLDTDLARFEADLKEKQIESTDYDSTSSKGKKSKGLVIIELFTTDHKCKHKSITPSHYFGNVYLRRRSNPTYSLIFICKTGPSSHTCKKRLNTHHGKFVPDRLPCCLDFQLTQGKRRRRWLKLGLK